MDWIIQIIIQCFGVSDEPGWMVMDGDRKSTNDYWRQKKVCDSLPHDHDSATWG